MVFCLPLLLRFQTWNETRLVKDCSFTTCLFIGVLAVIHFLGLRLTFCHCSCMFNHYLFWLLFFKPSARMHFLKQCYIVYCYNLFYEGCSSPLIFWGPNIRMVIGRVWRCIHILWILQGFASFLTLIQTAVKEGRNCRDYVNLFGMFHFYRTLLLLTGRTLSQYVFTIAEPFKSSDCTWCGHSDFLVQLAFYFPAGTVAFSLL